MTAQELIKSLSMYPPDMPIVVDGYEGGFDNAVRAETIRIALNANSEWYYGRHKQSEKVGDSEAVLIKGDRRIS